MQSGLLNSVPFDPLKLRNDDTREKEIKNGRLAMVAFVGFASQAAVQGKGPIASLQYHLADPFHRNSEPPPRRPPTPTHPHPPTPHTLKNKHHSSPSASLQYHLESPITPTPSRPAPLLPPTPPPLAPLHPTPTQETQSPPIASLKYFLADPFHCNSESHPPAPLPPLASPKDKNPTHLPLLASSTTLLTPSPVNSEPHNSL